MKTSINLTGWADGKIEFPLQIAMYEVTGDCDWEFDIKSYSKTGLVYNPFTFHVTATRVCTRKYENDLLVEKGIQQIKFSFQVKEYTKADVYTQAKEALKKLEGK